VKNLSDFEVFFLLSVLKVVVVLVITLTCVAYTVLLERKVAGRIQNRLGPSRVGPFGLLQPLTDGIKLFLKEDLTPLLVERPLFLVAPVIALGCSLISIAVVPFGPMFLYKGVDLFEISNTNIGLLVILGITSIGVYGIALSGWSSNNKYALLGSLRATSQMISYELALGLSLVGVVLRAGSLNLRAIVNSQSAHGLLSWNIFGGLQIVGFFVYLISAYAETNRTPFDLPEEYANMITVSCVATLLFFGGASSPFGHLFPNFGGPVVASLLAIFWFVLKVFCFLFLYVWVRWTLPRFRYDQLMGFGWRFLLPVAMLNIVFTSLVLALRS
jgi:NADH-quinone oxidoreductase subunit H